MVHDMFYSPLRSMRQPRFSYNGSLSPNENCPSAVANSSETSSSFPRQYMASPMKLNDRNVLFFLGSKIPSSVPGRRSSLGSIPRKSTNAPAVVFAGERSDMKEEARNPEDLKRLPKRSKSLKPAAECSASTLGVSGRTLKRL